MFFSSYLVHQSFIDLIIVSYSENVEFILHANWVKYNQVSLVSYCNVYFIKIIEDFTSHAHVYNLKTSQKYILKSFLLVKKQLWTHSQGWRHVVDCVQQGFQQSFDYVDNLEDFRMYV